MCTTGGVDLGEFPRRRSYRVLGEEQRAGGIIRAKDMKGDHSPLFIAHDTSVQFLLPELLQYFIAEYCYSWA